MVKYNTKRNKETIFQRSIISFGDYFDVVTFVDIFNEQIELYGFISMYEVLYHLLAFDKNMFTDLKDYSRDELLNNVIFTKKIKKKDISIKTKRKFRFIPYAEWNLKIPSYEIEKD